MDERPETAKCGFLALVAYVPAPQSKCLENIRQTLNASIKSQVHITVLPPRPLRIPLEKALQQIRHILSRYARFEVELLDVKSFPETNTIYLDVSDGRVLIQQLHSELNVGDLAHAEEFEFLPHLTLSGPCMPEEAGPNQKAAQSAWTGSDCDPRFAIDEIVFLWIQPDGVMGEWQRIGSQQLAPKDAPPLGAAATSGQTS